jgi:RNA polymerase sigma factor (sigma-70 family)
MVRALGRKPNPAVSDADLLERFVARRDEAAFELLVWRHERMVRGVTRRLLHREQDVEDVSQATFLTLACKAGSVGNRHSLGGWLYKVAYRIALRARSDLLKRGRFEKGPDHLDAVPAAGSPDCEADRQELRSLVEEEVSRLPEKYRTPVVLCYLEGKTNEEAASQLGCPTGTVVTWLARARQRLRNRLARRGVAVTAGSLPGILALGEAASAGPPAFLQPTVKAALLVASDKTAGGIVSTRVALLTKGALHAMFMDRLKIVAVVFLVVCLAGARPGILAYEKLSQAANPQASAATLRAGERMEQFALVLPVPAPQPATEQEKERRNQDARKSERANAQEVLTKTFKTGKSPKLIVEVFNGPIEVVSDSEGKVEAKVTKKSEAKTEEEAKEGLKNVDVQMAEEKGAIRITARRIEQRQKAQESASAMLHVPAGAILELKTANGAVSVLGGKGQAKIRTSNGAIRVKDHTGNLNLNSSNGAIEVGGATGQLELKTSNGPIRVEAQKAVVNAHTSNSEIDVRGSLANGSHILSTANGRISLTLPANATFRVDAQTSHGSIVDEFSPKQAKAGRGRTRLENVVGDNPKVSVRLRTANGSIEIRKQ